MMWAEALDLRKSDNEWPKYRFVSLNKFLNKNLQNGKIISLYNQSWMDIDFNNLFVVAHIHVTIICP